MMANETHCTTMWEVGEVHGHPTGGAFTFGCFIEGARWTDPTESRDYELEVDGVLTGGILAESRLKELLPPMPVMLVKAVVVQASWEPAAVGFIRPEPSLYNCPVFLTCFRGPTFVCLATLRTNKPREMWTLAGVALVMQTDA